MKDEYFAKQTQNSRNEFIEEIVSMVVEEKEARDAIAQSEELNSNYEAYERAMKMIPFS